MADPKTTSIAYLGMGIMGSAMAANLAAAGCRVAVWNRTPGASGTALAVSAGALEARSIAEAVAGATIVFTCVSDVADVEAVLFGPGGVAESAAAGTLVVDMSTIGPSAAKRMAAGLSGRGLGFMDAPVTGGDVGARNATLTIMIGGEASDLSRSLPFLEVVGKNIKHCGPVGSGQAIKLCNQILCAVNMLSLCEAMTLADALGADPRHVVEVCGTGAGGSWALSNLGPKILEGDLQPAFMVEHIIKDLRLIGECLDDNLEGLPATRLASERFARVMAMDGGGGRRQGTQAMIRTYRQEEGGKTAG